MTDIPPPANAPADPVAVLDEPSVLDSAKPADTVGAAQGADTVAGGTGADTVAAGEGDDAVKPLAGAPDAYALEMPEGVTLDADAWKVAEPLLKDANIGSEQAQKLAEGFPKIAEAVLQRAQAQNLEQIANIRRDWAREAQADPEVSGEANLATIAAGRDALLRGMGEDGAQLSQLFKDTGLGNNRLLLRLFKVAGVELGQATTHRSDISPAATRSPEERRFKPEFNAGATT